MLKVKKKIRESLWYKNMQFWRFDNIRKFAEIIAHRPIPYSLLDPLT